MKAFSLTILSFILFNAGFAQNNRSLENTKAYIVKMIDDYGYKHRSSSKLRAEFDGNLLKITTATKFLGGGGTHEFTSVYNFANVYKYKGPIRKAGDIAHLIIWVDYLSNPYRNKWSQKDLELDIHNYEAGAELMAAFRHLNKLLIENKPPVEKF